jgi:hypothetical protein
MPGKKEIFWNKETMRAIMEAHAGLVRMGMDRPSIRATLYFLMRTPPWKKSHYDTLCTKLGEWRDHGLIEWGLFSDDGAGAAYRPMTDVEIQERIKALSGAMRPSLAPDGNLWGVFVEHVGLVETIASWLDYRIPVVSSQGQLRREHLHSAISGWYHVAEVLNAKGVQCLALVDYDQGGIHIYRAHEDWLWRIFKLKPSLFAVTSQQLRDADLPFSEDHQLDGVIARYGVQRFRQELRRAVQLDGGPPPRRTRVGGR